MSEQKPMGMMWAPKDGTHILGYGLHHSEEESSTGWCEVHYHVWDSKCGGWYGVTEYPSEPTAWLPLPPTPTEET